MIAKWAPIETDREWLKSLFESLNENGIWMAPMTGQIFLKRGDSLVWTNEDVGDPADIFIRSKIIGKEIGVEVYRESEL
jgi:hypothetical protein